MVVSAVNTKTEQNLEIAKERHKQGKNSHMSCTDTFTLKSVIIMSVVESPL